MQFSSIGIAALSWIMSMGASQAQAPNEDSVMATVDRLSIKLPSAVAQSEDVRRPLEELGRERCDKQAIANLGKALQKAGYRREAATAHVSFSDLCGGHAPSLRAAANILFKLSDYTGTVTVASKLIELEPFNDNGYFLRATANDQGGLPKKAIDDYITAIELYGNKSRISSVSYLGLARSYEKLGLFCDAILPIETWVAINPAAHDNSQTRAIIAGYTVKGKCATATAAGEDVFPIAHTNNVITLPAIINGARGIFILDTGASYVTLKNSFAQKAKIEIESDSFLRLNTANGVGEGKRGRAKSIQLRSMQAKDVLVIVQADNKLLFGEGVDGLLGMSFLSRFNVTMGTKSVKISARAAR